MDCDKDDNFVVNETFLFQLVSDCKPVVNHQQSPVTFVKIMFVVET